jgi:hypothetical protein
MICHGTLTVIPHILNCYSPPEKKGGSDTKQNIDGIQECGRKRKSLVAAIPGKGAVFTKS